LTSLAPAKPAALVQAGHPATPNATDSTDYYNGSAPAIDVVSGDGQIGELNAFLPEPLIVQVTDSNGAPLVNAPVVFSGSNGKFALTNDSNASLNSTLTMRTDSNGQAAVYYQTPDSASVISIMATARAGNDYVSTPFTATANPASVRYAVIDLRERRKGSGIKS
jgi:hypothetical protein